MSNKTEVEVAVVGVQPLASLVEYQERAVVSRALIKKKTGNITLFAFDKGEELSEHTAPFDAFVYIVDGAAEIRIAGETHHLSQGDTIIMPANRPHAVKAINRFKMLLAMIRS